MKTTNILLTVLLIASACADRSFAQPILNRVEQFLRDQVGGGQDPAPPAAAAEPDYLGVTADDRQDLGRGVRVVNVTAGGPASQGGLLDGDLITDIDGQPIRVMEDMARALEGKAAGTKVTITVNRVGAQRQHEIMLGRRAASRVVGQRADELPQPVAAAADVQAAPRPRLGVRTIPVSEEARLQNGLATAEGATVVLVTDGSPAKQAGIPLGAVITAVDNRPINTPQALAAAIGQARDEVELTFVDRGLRVQRRVALALPAQAGDQPALQLRGRPLDQPDALQPGLPATAQQAPVPPPTAAPPIPPRPAPADAKAEEGPTLAAPPEDSAARIAQLEAQIRELQARIEKLEAALAKQPQQPQ